MAYLPENTRVTTALASTQKMEKSIQREVSSQVSNSNEQVMRAINNLSNAIGSINKNNNTNLNLDDVVDYGILVPGITAQQDEIIVVKAKEGKVDAVKASLEEHLKDLLSQRLYPTYMEAAEEAKVEVNGDLVSLFILDSEIKESVEEQYYKLIKK